MDAARFLIVTADDFGIGPATTRGILDLALAGKITSSVLLVNSPHAREAVQAWRHAGEPFEMGWHPCLTLDQPIAQQLFFAPGNAAQARNSIDYVTGKMEPVKIV